MSFQPLSEYPGVIQAERANFLLQKGVDRNSAVIALRDPLDGPQVITLHLILRLSKHGSFHAKYLANLVVHVSQYKKQSNLFPTIWMITTAVYILHVYMCDYFMLV